MKSGILRGNVGYRISRSREGAWIEIAIRAGYQLLPRRRSREGAWIEMCATHGMKGLNDGRSREGAWIEISVIRRYVGQIRNVAPVRERGLK